MTAPPGHAKALAAVALGSVVGALLRTLAGASVEAWLGAGFPWGTLFVNITGSFAIGLCAAATPPDRHALRLFVMAGVCGGYTTFSAFSLDTLQLLQSGAGALAAANIGLSIVTWLAAIWAGDALGRRWRREPGAPRAG
jgi:CrcB protein